MMMAMIISAISFSAKADSDNILVNALVETMNEDQYRQSVLSAGLKDVKVYGDGNDVILNLYMGDPDINYSKFSQEEIDATKESVRQTYVAALKAQPGTIPALKSYNVRYIVNYIDLYDNYIPTIIDFQNY